MGPRQRHSAHALSMQNRGRRSHATAHRTWTRFSCGATCSSRLDRGARANPSCFAQDAYGRRDRTFRAPSLSLRARCRAPRCSRPTESTVRVVVGETRIRLASWREARRRCLWCARGRAAATLRASAVGPAHDERRAARRRVRGGAARRATARDATVLGERRCSSSTSAAALDCSRSSPRAPRLASGRPCVRHRHRARAGAGGAGDARARGQRRSARAIHPLRRLRALRHPPPGHAAAPAPRRHRRRRNLRRRSTL